MGPDGKTRTYWNLADGYQIGFRTQLGTWISLSTVAPNTDAISTMPWVKDTGWRWGCWGREEALRVSVSAFLRAEVGPLPPPPLFYATVKARLFKNINTIPPFSASWLDVSTETLEKRLISALGREVWLLLHWLCSMWSSELSLVVIVPQRQQPDEWKETRLPQLKAESHVRI